MASTWSKLKIELIGTGEQSGTWGTTTNNNLGSSSTYRGLEQAIVGMATLVTGDFTSNSYTMPYTDSSDDQDFRCLFLNITATLSAAGTVIVPAIQKPYIVKNASVGGFAVTVKVSGQTGVSVPNGALILLYNDGTDVGVAVNYLTSLTLGSALPIASGGTGTTSTTFVNLASNVTGTLPVANGGTGVTTSTGSGNNVLSTSPTLVTPLLGTPTSVTLTNATGLPLTTGVTGTLPIASGGTGTTSTTFVNLASNVTGTLPVANGGTGATTLTGVLKGNGTSAFTASNVSLSSEVTGTLPVANGGTGATTLTSNNVILGNGTSAVQFVAPGANGNVLISNGTTWTSAAISGAVTTSANNAFTGANTFYNATGQTFAPASTNDGIIIQGRAGGTSTYRVTFATATLSANRTLTFPDATDTAAVLGIAQTFTAAQTFRAANAIRSEAASTQDAIVVAGRAGGTSSYAVTLTPTTLSANRSATFPDSDTIIPIATQQLSFIGPLAARSYTLPDASASILTTNAAVTVAQGGTGLTSGTSGGVLAFTASGTLASSGALTANALVIGGGAGAAPSTTTTGTGILTFLGTPSSANLAAAVTDETGSGSLVFGTSPTITTPRIVTSINDTNGNEVFGITATASAVNEVTVTNAATGNSPKLSASGGDTNVALTLAGKGTGDVVAQVNSTNVFSVSSTFGFKNRIINGGMAVSQYYGTGSTTTGSGGYVIDRWLAQYGSGTLTFQQTTSVVPAGFAYAESVTVTSAGTRNAGDYFLFTQVVEGLNVSDLGFGAAGAATVTLSFWVRSSVTGTYSGVLASGDNNRTYAFTYSIPSANTWTQISVTIAGDTSGGQTAYPINNTAGLRLKFDLGSGSNYQISASSWQAATNKIGTSSQVGWAQTAGATFYITGVQLEKGSTATSFDYRPYGTELALCQRYYQHRVPTWGTSRSTDNYIHSSAYFKVTMRTDPTLTQAYNTFGQTISIQYQNADYYVTGATGTASSSLDAGYNASAEL